MRTEDGTIIQKCLNGESEAFGMLIDKYKAGIFALVWHKLRNFHDAEEVTQEVFIKAYKYLRTLRRWDSFAIWLYSIAHEGCRKWFRSQLRRPDHNLIGDRDIEELRDTDAMDSYRENKMYDSLHDALDSLPEIYQEVLTLHYFGGMTGEEIAKIMCISPSAVRQRLSRARVQLKEEMVAMMSETFKEHRLQANFTFRIVEMIKRIKINPVSTTKCLPYGLSLAVGIAIVIMSFNPNLSQYLTLDTPTGFPLPVEAKVLKFGEMPVDTVQVSQLPALSNGMEKGKGGNMQNTFFLAPQAEGGTWVRKADIPFVVENHSLISVNDKIYVIGGTDKIFDLALKPFSSLYEYEPKTDNWVRKSDIPTPRAYFRASVMDGKIYAFGGWTSGGFSNAVEAYDPITDSWEKKADMPTARAEAVTEQINGKIYVIGGHNQHSGKCLSAIEEYDPKTNSWTKKNDMPVARSFAASCVIDDKIYIFGGTSTL